MEEVNMEYQSLEPTWKNRDQSPLLEIVGVQEFSKYKIKLRYGGYFRIAKNSSTKRYCFGYQKCVYIDTCVYNFDDLIEEVVIHYHSDRGLNFSIWFIEKNAIDQSFIKGDSHDKFQVMLSMYEVEKELSVYVEYKLAYALEVAPRDANWDTYVDSYFIIEKYKLAYALEVAPMPTNDQLVHIDIEEKIYPPTIKRPPEKPRKNRIKPNDETKKRQKCKRCGEYGHLQKTCKNAAPQDQASTSERKR